MVHKVAKWLQIAKSGSLVLQSVLLNVMYGGGGIHGRFAILKKEVLLLEINIFNCSQSFYESKEQIKSFRRL